MLQVLTLRDEDGQEQTIRVTEEHPFYRESDSWTPARKLSAGDTILGADGTVAVLSNELEPHPQGVAVYNLEVADEHTYFVFAENAPDAAAVWVHNANYDTELVNDLRWQRDGSVRFRGKRVQVTEDLTHLNDARLLEIAEAGIAPRTVNGEVVHLHHVGQRANGPLWELSEGIHLNTHELHPLGKAAGVGLSVSERAAFDLWRNDYWRASAGYELRMLGY